MTYSPHPLTAALGGLALLASCSPGTTTTVASSDQAIAGKLGEIEWSIDAPWRLEPERSGGYSRIPITFTFHDGSEQKDPDAQLNLQTFCGVSVAEVKDNSDSHQIHRFQLRDFHEVESHPAWDYSSNTPSPSAHKLARVWDGDDPTTVASINDSAIWGATLQLRPQLTGAAGQTARLMVVALVSSTGNCPSLPNQMQAITGPQFEKLGDVYYFRGNLKVQYGDPLPRFSDAWVYGDVHYHSQGTDNEGEAGAPYRPTLQMMKALGLDFAFATEHASDSGQLTGVLKVFLTDLPDGIPIPGWIKDIILDMIDAEFSIPHSMDQLRDMNAARYKFLWHWLNDSNGVNAEVLSSDGLRAPQLFIGGEVDAIPEISAGDRAAGKFRYGNGLYYPWANTCGMIPEAIKKLISENSSYRICPDGPASLVEEAREGDRYLLKDVQGWLSDFYARQHFVHLPQDPNRDDAFVSSQTTLFGGAWWRLVDLLRTHYDVEDNKGVLFLAHPVDAASGSGMTRFGPDIVPYSDIQLRTAMRSPSVLGLQLWNGDTRFKSKPGQGFPMAFAPRTWPLGSWADQIWGWQKTAHDGELSALHHGTAMWDRMLLWGLDPAQRPGWVPLGEPRRVFMAGGSDGHGDFNFRRGGYVLGWDSTSDTAMGKPRNLVSLDGPLSKEIRTAGKSANTFTQDQVVNGLKSGEFIVTDGPIVRIAVDMNGNNRIDDGDVPMGAIADYSCQVPLLVEWKSTPEFGPIDRIDLYMGGYRYGYQSRVYAPENHAVRGAGDKAGTVDGSKTVTHADGRKYRVFHDGYAKDPSGLLRIKPGDGYQGTRKVMLTPHQYELWETACTSERVCEIIQGREECFDVDSCEISKRAAPTRSFVRAFAHSVSKQRMSTGSDHNVDRMAYTNPIWLTPDGSSCPFCPAFDSSPEGRDGQFCTNWLCPCNAGEGDCDNDNQCKGDLICSQDVGTKYGLPSRWDVCEPKPLPIFCPAFDKNNPDVSFCTSDCPCDLGEGDCDFDGQCEGSLICGRNNGDHFGLPASWEVCIKPGPLCGNGEPNPGEECDDANRTNGDGCSSSCQVESGWLCPRWDACIKKPKPCFPRCGDWGF